MSVDLAALERRLRENAAYLRGWLGHFQAMAATSEEAADAMAVLRQETKERFTRVDGPCALVAAGSTAAASHILRGD